MSNVAKLKKRALDYEQKKQFDKALDAYMQVLSALGDHVDEKDVALFNRVGDLLLRQGNVGAAVDHYERAVDLYTEGGFHNNAIALCSKILRNAPGRNSVYYKLGRISAKKGFTSDAKSNFLEYADRMQRIGHVEEAFRALKEFADLCPDQDDIRLMLADQLVRGDRKAEAIEQLQLLYEKFQAEGRTQEAKATLERMTAIDPSHQPTAGISRPTPKANDLIFLDVGFDTPGAPARTVTGSIPVVPAADATPVAPPLDDALPADAADQPLPMIDVEESDTVTIAPVDGLSSNAMFDAGDDTVTTGAHEVISQMNTELITGFEETSFGVTDDVTDAVHPLPGVEQSTPLVGGDGTVDLSLDTVLETAPEVDDTRVARAEQAASDDSLQLLDISLDIIDDGAPDSGDALTLIFPDADDGDQWNGGISVGGDVVPADSTVTNSSNGKREEGFAVAPPDNLERLAPVEDEIRIEPLLQLPDLDTLDGSVETLGHEPDLPLISQGDEGLSPLSSLDYSDALIDYDAQTPTPELRFLDMGGDSDLPAISQPDEPAPAVVDAAAPDPPAVAAEHERAEPAPDDWEARRRRAEAMLEAGDRDGGLAELEAVMLGLEHAGDLRGASALVNEIIRVEPHSVRYHQKRVEYAVRANDRSALAEAYYSLAESLFQMGEIEKSRAVYARVLELSPGDARARAAIQAIDADGADDGVDVPEPPGQPTVATTASTNGASHDSAVVPPAIQLTAPASATEDAMVRRAVAEALEPPDSAHASSTPAELAAVPRPRLPEPEPVGSASDDFVNLSEWLSEDAPTRNTRMVVDVKEPEIQEQVDFTEMLAMFKQGVAANVDEADHEAHYDLGVAYKEMGLLDEAISEFQKALRGTGNRARTYEALGQCFVERGQHQIAVTILSRALGDKSYTDDMLVGVLYLLGYASETLGRWADAQRFYERVFAVDIEFRDIGQRLAVVERAGK
ncbi:MAG TPA: tetratricopeptide repeat protein [Gemmatimonadaceae bacterium]|nr:tetratricopeptide repeat protein [Gemmatimonadaceae bacterium]